MAKNKKIKIWYIFSGLLILIFSYYLISVTPFGTYDFKPEALKISESSFGYTIPLDPESPWPKFRNNALQNGRSGVKPVVNKKLKPWVFQTGKGIFSSPVIDGEGTVYIGSADQYFYALNKNGSLKWKYKTEEVIDSSALLDEKKHVYVGSGDAHVYAFNRENGKLIWKFKADDVETVEKKYNIKSYNVNWFEGNIAILKDGTLIAPNDNFLIYLIDRENGQKKNEFLTNEMNWSLPTVNINTNRIFAGSQYMASKNVFAFNTKNHETEWTNGGWGSNSGSPVLTNSKENGALVIGGFDGYVRAYTQDSGKQLWKFGVRGHIYASPAQLSDGTIIQPSTDGTVYALNPETGEMKWAFDTLEPIRSSPAIDAEDNIYVGSGEGRLFCIHPDGTLRWSYLLIEEYRNDLNSSPALGKDGVVIAGESGGIFFVPYDYPLTEAGKKDPKSTLGPNEVLPNEGEFLIYTTQFGGLPINPPKKIEANQPLVFTLFVRKNGDTIKSGIDRDSLKISVKGNEKYDVKVAANMEFMMIIPKETWVPDQNGNLEVSIDGFYLQDFSRFGLKFFWGNKGGKFNKKFTFKINSHNNKSFPYKIPQKDDGKSTVFAFYRHAAPNPTMLPSWNQIGFDSLHYLGGIVEGDNNKMLLWMIPGKLQDGKTVVNPDLRERFPLTLEYDSGLLTMYNYDGFKINFVGSWDMPFGMYRMATTADPHTGQIQDSPSLVAVALGDELEYYGRFLKLMGMTEFDTGHMPVFGGTNMSLHGKGFMTKPDKIGETSFELDKNFAKVTIKNGKLKQGKHVYSLLLINRKNGRSFPLYYTKNTKVKADENNFVNEVSVTFDEGEVIGDVCIYYMVDTYPVAKIRKKL